MKLPQRSSATEPRVDMIPLIDVVFLILVAFIYASMFMSQKIGLPVDLPEASETITEMSEVLTLTINKDGALFLGDRSIELAQLNDAFATAKATNSEDFVLYVLADREAQVDLLIQVMDQARKAGISGLTIAAERPVTPTPVQ